MESVNSSQDREIAVLKEKVASHDKAILAVCEDIKEIKDKLIQRPSWATMTIITMLSTLCVWLIVFIATKWS